MAVSTIKAGGTAKQVKAVADYITPSSGYTFYNADIAVHEPIYQIYLLYSRNAEQVANNSYMIGTLKAPYRPIINVGFSTPSLRGVVASNGEIYIRPYTAIAANHQESVSITMLA